MVHEVPMSTGENYKQAYAALVMSTEKFLEHISKIAITTQLLDRRV